MRLVSAAYYAGDRWISEKRLSYNNPDVVAYVEAVRLRYTMRKARVDRYAKEVGGMKHFEVFLAVMLLPLPVLAADHAIPARVATLTIDPREVTSRTTERFGIGVNVSESL
jgi:hypothetical protein